MDAEIAERRRRRSQKQQKVTEHIEQLVKKGDEGFKAGNYPAAGESYVAVLQKYGARPIPMAKLASCYNRLSKHLEAEEVATVALEYGPTSIVARYERAIARKHLRSFRAALKDFNSILAQDQSQDEIREEIRLLESAMVQDPGFTLNEFEEEHPRYTDEPWEINEDLDDEESRGDRRYHEEPCPSYNHGSCLSGENCELRHGPDTRSVRDERGRNVCADLLMGTCRATGQESSCPYSHCTTYLPPNGWWQSADGIEAVMYTRGYIDGDYEDVHEAVQRMPRASGFAWATLKQAMIPELCNQFLDIRPYTEADYDEMEFEATDGGWSSDEEKYIRPYIEQEFPTLPRGRGMTLPTNPFVLIINDREEFSTNKSLYTLLDLATTTVYPGKFADKIDTTLQHLDSPLLTGVLVTDPHVLSHRQYTVVIRKLFDFVKGGGSLVIGGDIMGYMGKDVFDDHMEGTFGLNWRFGSYGRDPTSVNPDNELAARNPSLDKSLFVKAVNISHIEPHEAVYLHSDDPETLYSKTTRGPILESPAVCTRIGKGFFSIMGDVNCEDGSQKIIMAMLGTLDIPNNAA